jgi:hypothetical protein
MLGGEATVPLVCLINGRWRANPVAVIRGRGKCGESVWVAAQTQVWAAQCFQIGTLVSFEGLFIIFLCGGRAGQAADSYGHCRW